jgi:hypothetical protein
MKNSTIYIQESCYHCAEFDGGKSMAKKKQPEVVVHNFVAKHMHEVNKSQVFVDRKKNAKRGYSKHKKGGYSNDYLPFLCAA